MNESARRTTGTDGADCPPAVATLHLPGFELLEEVGRGGMGIVFRARDLALEREVAVKILSQKFGAESGTARRFVDEARITAQLQHPGVPAVHQVGRLADDRPFLAMKLIKGRTLDAVVNSGAAVDALGVFEATCQAVAFAHAHGVIHRDLKPANVMVGPHGEVQVLDWGLAKVLSAGPATGSVAADGETLAAATEIRTARESDGSQTQAGSVLGTPAFMPPEQAAGELDKVDTRSDVFGLGGILCVLLTGQPPIEGATPEAVRLNAVRGRTEAAFGRLDASGGDPGAVALCKRCLAFEPVDRPATAVEVADAVAGLRRAANERARQAEISRAMAVVQADAERRRARLRLLLTLGSCATLAIAIGAAAYVRHVRGQAAAERRSERERLIQAHEATLTRAEAALRSGDRSAAAAILDQAAEPPEELAAREGVLREAVAMDAALQRIRDARFNWIGGANGFDADTPRREYPAAFARHGIDLAHPTDAAAAVAASPIRDRLLAGLEDWLVVARDKKVSLPLRDLTAKIDPDDYRCSIRTALADRSPKELVALLSRPEAAGLPPRFIALAGGMWSDLPDAFGTPMLRRAALAHPGDFDLLFTLALRLATSRPPATAEAAGFYRAALAARPDSSAALNNLGLLLKDLGDVAGETECLEAALRIDPANLNARSNLGFARLRAGATPDAAALFARVLEANPASDGAHVGLAMIATEAKDHAVAERHYRKLAELNPSSSLGPSLLAAHLLARFRLGEAQEAAREAIRRNPESDDGHVLLGKALLATFRRSAAAAEFKAALRLNPDNSAAHLHLGSALLIDDKWPAALPHLRRAMELGVDAPQEYTGVANACRLNDRYAEAAAIWFAAIRHHPTWAAERRVDVNVSAAKAAAVAGTGGGDDAPADPAERRRLRTLAHAAMTAELALWNGRRAAERDAVARKMRSWLSDTDLTRLRRADHLEKLPADERLAWEKFWADVERLQATTTDPAASR